MYKSRVIKNPRIDIDEVELVRLYKSGQSLMSLARQYSCNVSAIKRRLIGLGVYVPDTHNGAHRSSKCDSIDNNELIALYLDGHKLKYLADHFGCSIPTIRKKLINLDIYKK